MRKMNITFLLLFLLTIAHAQRQGALETGGLFAFKNHTDQNNITQNNLEIDWLVGYYLNRDAIIEIVPNFGFDFNSDSVHFSSVSLINLSYRIMDMSTYDRREISSARRRDLGVTAGVFASVGAGLWLESGSLVGGESVNSSGAAYSLGIGTHAGFGKYTVMRTKFEFVYLLPDDPIYKNSRTTFRIGVGFTVFIKI